MPQSKTTIASMLEGAGTRPKHRFGQNFMVDQNLVRVVAAAGAPGPGDLVVEVGPGTGTLTEAIMESGAAVVAVEIDRDLAGVLRQQFAGREGFTLIEGDALDGKHDLNPELARIIRERVGGAAAAVETGEPRGGAAEGVAAEGGAVRMDGAGQHGGAAAHGAGEGGDAGVASDARAAAGGGGGGGGVKLIANLPYNIASPLVVDLLLEGVGTLVFTVQKEVADRLRAKAGEEAYGPITATVQRLARVEVLRTLPPGVFWPAPKIDSALVRLTREDRLGGRARAFSQFVQQLFQSRRKMLRKGLAFATAEPEAVLTRLGIEPTDRCEGLSPDRLWELFCAVGGGE